MNKTFIALHTELTHTTYYIKFDYAQDSLIKAKNVLVNTLMNDLNEEMKVLVESDKNNIKALKNDCTEELNDLFKATTSNTLKEVKADIKKSISNKSKTEVGFILLADGSKKDVQGEKFITNLLQDKDIAFLLIKENRQYQVIDKKSGILVAKSKYKKDIVKEFNTLYKDVSIKEYKEKINSYLSKCNIDAVYSIESPIDITPVSSDINTNSTTTTNNNKLKISIQGKTESYTSIFNFTYNIATEIEVYKNDSLIYTANNLYIPLNAPKQAQQINLHDYANKLAYYIYYNKLDTYNLNKQLDSFFKDKCTLFLDIRYREIKNELQQLEKEKKQQQENIVISNLKQQLKVRCNNKNYAFVDTYDNIFILNNTDKRDLRTIQDDNTFKDLFEDLTLYNKDKYNVSKEIKDRIVLNKDFISNKTILENTLQLYA